MIGKLVAAAGVVCGLLAIWVGSVPGDNGGNDNYWNDGTFGGSLLILLVLTALLLGGATATQRRDLTVAAGAVGTVALGMLMLIPVLFAFDQWDLLAAGAFLGLCAGLIPVGTLIALGRPAAPPPAPAGRRPAAGLAALGLALVLAGIWPDAVKVSEGPSVSYWTFTGLGHSAGICLLVLVIVGGLLLAAAYVLPGALDATLLIAALTLGFTLFFPIATAFDDLGQLRAGAWLAAVGGLVFVIGALALRGGSRIGLLRGQAAT